MGGWTCGAWERPATTQTASTASTLPAINVIFFMTALRDIAGRTRSRGLRPLAGLNQPPKLVSMAMPLVLGAVTHDRHGSSPGEKAEQAEGELLPVVLDRAASSVDRPVHEELGAI